MGLFGGMKKMFDGKPGSPVEDWLRNKGVIGGAPTNPPLSFMSAKPVAPVKHNILGMDEHQAQNFQQGLGAVQSMLGGDDIMAQHRAGMANFQPLGSPSALLTRFRRY